MVIPNYATCIQYNLSAGQNILQIWEKFLVTEFEYVIAYYLCQTLYNGTLR